MRKDIKVIASAGDDNIFRLWDQDGNYHDDMEQDEKIKMADLFTAAPNLLECLAESTALIEDALKMLDDKSVVSGCLRVQLGLNKASLLAARGGV